MGLYPGVGRTGWGRSHHSKPFGFAVLATLGFVAKLFVVKKQLFTGGEDKVCTAVNTFQHPVLEFHCQLLRPSESRKRMSAMRVLAPPFLRVLLPLGSARPHGEVCGIHLRKNFSGMDAQLDQRFLEGRATIVIVALDFNPALCVFSCVRACAPALPLPASFLRVSGKKSDVLLL